MSLYARMVKLQSARIGQRPDSRGQAILVTTSAEKGNDGQTEVWQGPGVMGVPPDVAYGILLPAGSGSFDAVVAVQNYALAPPSLAKGEAMTYSTDAAGSLLKASIKHRSDGSLELNGNSKRLVTNDLVGILATFITALNASLLAAGGTTVSLDISSAITTTVKTGG